LKIISNVFVSIINGPKLATACDSFRPSTKIDYFGKKYVQYAIAVAVKATSIEIALEKLRLKYLLLLLYLS
jgi:hypothetical protein